jgi:hypothetical protein
MPPERQVRLWILTCLVFPLRKRNECVKNEMAVLAPREDVWEFTTTEMF